MSQIDPVQAMPLACGLPQFVKEKLEPENQISGTFDLAYMYRTVRDVKNSH